MALNGKFGFINKTGQQVVACKYDRIGSFSADRKVLGKLGNDLKQIDRNGAETELTSTKPELPAKIGDKWIVDFTIGSSKSGETQITVIGTGFEIELIFLKGKPAMSVPVGCTFTSGEKEYTSKNMSMQNGFGIMFKFETTDRPEAVTFYLNNKPDEKIRIECKEQQTENLK